MSLPPVFRRNIETLAARAAAGQAAYGRGVLVVAYEAGRAQGISFLPEGTLAEQLGEAPVLLELALEAVVQYDPAREFVLLAISAEGDEPLCWILEQEPGYDHG